ncbi:MAG: hypothetical protein WDM94_01305 [Bauldia sp.]
MSPARSDDLSERIDEQDGAFLAWRSDESAEDEPNYTLVGSFVTREAAATALGRQP